LSARNSRRELCPRAKWRRKRAWQSTISPPNPLNLLLSDFEMVGIPDRHPTGIYRKRRCGSKRV
jgi:hypothetical protein